MMKSFYKWAVFVYISLSMVLYLGGFWPFKEHIFEKSWLSTLPTAPKYIVSSVILLLCCILFITLLMVTMRMKFNDPYILLSEK